MITFIVELCRQCWRNVNVFALCSRRCEMDRCDLFLSLSLARSLWPLHGQTYFTCYMKCIRLDDCICIENKNIHLICNKLHSKKSPPVWLPCARSSEWKCVCFYFACRLRRRSHSTDVECAFECLLPAARMHDALRYFVTHICFIFFFPLLSSFCSGFAICKCGRRRRRWSCRRRFSHTYGIGFIVCVWLFACVLNYALYAR